jgi:hypothetical protein
MPSAKLLARSKPKFKFRWVISITLRFIAAAFWFAVSKNFVRKYMTSFESYVRAPIPNAPLSAAPCWGLRVVIIPFGYI